MKKLDLQKLVILLHTFTWNIFANEYLEFCKDKLTKNRKYLLAEIFTKLLKLWSIIGKQNLYNKFL